MRTLLWTSLLLLPLTACFDKADDDEDDGDGASDGGGWDLGDGEDSGMPGDGGSTDDPAPDTDEPDPDTDDTDTDPDTDTDTDTDDTDTDVDPSPWDGSYAIDSVLIAWDEELGTMDEARCTGGRFEFTGGTFGGEASCSWEGIFSGKTTGLALDGAIYDDEYVEGTAVLVLDGYPAEGFFEGGGHPGEVAIYLYFPRESTGGFLTVEGDATLYLP